MKRIILSFLFLLVLCSPALAQVPFPGPGMVHATSVACSSSNDTSLTENTTINSEDWAADTVHWNAQSFTIASTKTITCYVFKMNDTATYDNVTVTVALYTDNSGEPSASMVSGSNVSKHENTIDNGVMTEYEVCLGTPISLGAGTYWLLFSGTGTDTSTNKLPYNSSSSYANGYRCVSSNQGSSWTKETNHDLYFKIMGCN